MKIVILDRDGVINYDSPNYIKSPAEWIPLPGSLEAIARLYQAGYTITVATNQSGLARGYFDLAVLDSIHQKMFAGVAALGGKIDRVFFCPHGPEDNCRCRKPAIGLFEQIAAHYQCQLTGIPAVGDSLRDIQAAKAVGCIGYLVLTGNGTQTRLRLTGELAAVNVYPDLSAVAEQLLRF